VPNCAPAVELVISSFGHSAERDLPPCTKHHGRLLEDQRPGYAPSPTALLQGCSDNLQSASHYALQTVACHSVKTGEPSLSSLCTKNIL